MSEAFERVGRLARVALRSMQNTDGLSLGWQAAIFLVSLIAIFSRLPGALLHPQFFAEDGWVWYQQAYNLNWLRPLGIPQAGFFYTFPRMIASLTLVFPMQWAPLIMNVAGAVIQALPVAALLSYRCKSWGPLPVRLLMAALYIAIPDAPELHIVLTNAVWHLAVLQALIAFSVPPQTKRERLLDVLLFSIGGTTGPFCVLLLPFVVAYWWVRRQRWTLVILSLTFLAAAVQLLSIQHSARTSSAPLGATIVLLLRIVAGNIFVDDLLGRGGGYMHLRWLLLIAVGGLTILAWSWRNGSVPLRLYMGFTIFAFAASLKDPLVVGSNPRWQALATVAGIRYWFLPSLMFLWSAAWCAYEGKPRLARYAGAGVLVFSLISSIRHWTYPSWSETGFSAEVEQFKTLRPGEHMTFEVHGLSERRMDLIKK